MKPLQRIMLAVLLILIGVSAARKKDVFDKPRPVVHVYLKTTGPETNISEVIKQFENNCGDVAGILTFKQEGADYSIIAQDDGSGALRSGRHFVLVGRKGQ